MDLQVYDTHDSCPVAIHATEFRLALAEWCSVAAGWQSLNSFPGPYDSHLSQEYYKLLSTHPAVIPLRLTV